MSRELRCDITDCDCFMDTDVRVPGRGVLKPRRLVKAARLALFAAVAVVFSVVSGMVAGYALAVMQHGRWIWPIW